MDDRDRKTLDQPLIREFLFFPQRIREDMVPAEEEGSIILVPAGDDILGAYWYRPFPDRPTVLFFHGNGEVMTDYLYGFHQQIASLGLNFLVVDYRGYGLSTGAPTLSRLLEDADAAWKHTVKGLGLKPDRIVVMGRSLGSIAALQIVSDLGREARALVIESGIGSFTGWIGRMGPMLEQLGMDVQSLKQALAKHFDHQQKIQAFPGPVLIMHAPYDEIVPVEQAESLASWGEPSRTRLHIFPEGGHNDIQMVNGEEYFLTLRDFFAEALK